MIRGDLLAEQAVSCVIHPLMRLINTSTVRPSSPVSLPVNWPKGMLIGQFVDFGLNSLP
jgi:hypothetical protein